jgi:Zn-dependent peptidase ImmA (M78 family)
MFTLAHELAHIALGQSAVSDAQPSQLPEAVLPEERIERWCNQMAAELLVPLVAFRAEYRTSVEWPEEARRLARVFKVSTLVVLRRMYDAGGLTRELFWEAYDAEVERLKALPTGGGGDFYLTLGARVGRRFSRAVVTSTIEGRSSFTDAFRLLGFKKMSTFRSLSQELGIRF